MAARRRPEGTYDVAIVGGALAGCVAAMRFAAHGISVALVEKKRNEDDYKTLCTHFIQPIAFALLSRLGLDRLIEAAGGLRTKAAFWTECGWIDPPGEAYAAGECRFAYNIERRILDPLLRRRVALAPGVERLLGHRALGLERRGGLQELELEDADGRRRTLRARLVVAADGRNSTMARILANDAASSDNHRAAFFAYFTRIAPTPANRSLFMLYRDEMGFLYPLCEGRTLLSVYVKKERALEWRAAGDKASLLGSFLREFPCMPDIAQAEPVSAVYGYADYPNWSRAPVHQGVAFVGDAALSLDPMSGVGCAFAAVGADALVECTHRGLLDDGELDGPLEAYGRAHKERLEPHAEGIRADSLIGKSPESVRRIYENIVSHAALREAFIALTGRLIAPREFQKQYLGALTQKARNATVAAA